MKIATLVSAVISSLAPMAFADDTGKVGHGIPVENYNYGMQLDVASVLERTDNSGKSGVVPSIMVYRDSQGELHKVRFLEWGGKASQNG